MAERAKDELELFSGTSNPALAREVCEHLGIRLGNAEVSRFPDGEIMVATRMREVSVSTIDAGGMRRRGAMDSPTRNP